MTGPRHADRPSHVAQFTNASTSETSPLNPDTLEVAPGTIHESVQGWVPKLATEEELHIALEKAFDYRGDVTVTLKDNSSGAGFHRQGHGCRKELGGLGRQILAEEDFWGRRFEPSARIPRVRY